MKHIKLIGLLFVALLTVAGCGTLPAPTTAPVAPTSTGSAPPTLVLATPTLFPTTTTAPSATSVPPTSTSVPPTTTPSATATTAPPLPPLSTPTVSTPVVSVKYQAPTLVRPLSKDVHTQKALEDITFKWNPPGGVSALGANECYRLEVASYYINGPKKYADYFVVCDKTEFTLHAKAGVGDEVWDPFVPKPPALPETMEIRWTVTVVLAGAILDKDVHRQTTPLSPPSAEGSFQFQTLIP